MPRIDLFLNKTIEQNAALYYEKAKKAKHKKEGVIKAIEDTKRKLEKLIKEKDSELKKLQQKQEKQNTRKKEWYEKFHWFYSSEGFLCIGGRDATSNEIIVKKHTDKEDFLLHTDMAGSPFFVIKNGQKAGEKTLQQAAQATASYSRAWKLGHATMEVFYVKPEQVSKTSQPGEFMPKGAFMIRGETKYIRAPLEIAIGVKENITIGGPDDAIQNQINKVIRLIPGKDKSSDIAKKIKHALGGDIDDIISFIPAGGSAIKK